MSLGLGDRFRVHAPAKINLGLRVLDRRVDGYHAIRTTFQSIELHDTLTFERCKGPFALQCSDPDCPSGPENLVWRAGELLWRSMKQRGRMQGVSVAIEKHIPSRAGLGGGSSDAAAALRALALLWGLEDHSADALTPVAAELGADVPFFLHGGAALGVDRGDVIFPLVDPPSRWVVVVRPPFGVSTADAYRWFDEDRQQARPAARRHEQSALDGFGIPASELRNDLQDPVVIRYPAIARVIRSLHRSGASYAAMSGSGSAAFGLFPTRLAAQEAAGSIRGRGIQTLVTRTLHGAEARRLMRPRA
jgi:4-diphosphocytidyl-2-C-methyl-D-erythritol kinase